jgi:hypothetical protein
MKAKLQMNRKIGVGSLNVLIVYDNVCSGKRAKELCDRLGKLSREYKLNPSFWNLSVLRIAPLAQAAATAATRAALLIVSVNGNAALSPFIKNWISRYARETQALGGALVAQLHGIARMKKELSPAYGCLKQIAQDAGVAFFSGAIGPAAKHLAYVPSKTFSLRYANINN